MAGRRLDLDIGQQAEFAAQRSGLGKTGKTLALAGIERKQNGIRGVTNAATTIRGAL